MSDYPVNLPKTHFAMRAQLPQNEPKWLTFWQERQQRKQQATYGVNKDNDTDNSLSFILHDGPPYANGNIHIGHAFNKIVKDLINKAQALEGCRLRFIPGWDCHGLPIELQVEKQLGRVGKTVSASQFIEACKQYAQGQINLQRASFQRLGIFADWQHPYITMDHQFEALVARALTEALEQGYLVRGYKPVYWCSRCGSALAEAEVEYRNKQSLAIDVAFTMHEPERLGLEQLIVPIWTTTPWTLPANQAVAVNPNFSYLVVRCLADLDGDNNNSPIKRGEQLLVAKGLATTVLARYGISAGDDSKSDKGTHYEIIQELTGDQLEGLRLQHPLENRTVPIILGEHVTQEMGTGAVHTAPAHGADDYQAGLHYQLPIATPVRSDGKFSFPAQSTDLTTVGDLVVLDGLQIQEAETVIVELLQRHGKLLAQQRIEHSYPHCWRHKTPLIFRATAQWFISMDKINPARGKSLRQEALESLNQITWLPASGENSMRRMIEQRPDWCISRQRVYGSPIPLLIHKTSQQIHPRMAGLLRKWIIPGIAQQGIMYWQQLQAADFLREHDPDASATNADEYLKVTDTLDVWFDSGASHYAVLQHGAIALPFPADLYLEGMDQYRGWFQSSLLISLMLNGRPPYKRVLAHGFTVDAQGHKMSKSLGNVIDPQTIVQRYGADVLRLWAANSYLYDDVAISQEILDRTVDHYRLMRNSLRFLLGNLNGFKREQLLTGPELLPLDRYALWMTVALVQQSRKQLANYQYYTIGAALHKFLTNFLSGFYFSAIKDRLYTMQPTSPGRLSAQSTLFYLAELLIALLSPMISFTAEEAWQELRQLDPSFQLPTSIFDLRWIDLQEIFTVQLQPQLGDPTATQWQLLLKCREAVNQVLETLRAQGVIGSSLEAQVTLAIVNNDNPGARDLQQLLHHWQDELRWLFIVSEVVVLDRPSQLDTFVQAQLTEQMTIAIAAQALTSAKCERCWHHKAEVGTNATHPTLCQRCIDNLWGTGESRRLA